MGMAVASFLLIEAAMEIGILLPQQAMIELLAFLFTFGLWKSWWGDQKAGAVSTPPEVLGRWPIIGYILKLMDDKLPLAPTLGDLADKHGPLFTVWIGVHRTVVVNNWEMAKECCSTSDKALASRPSFAAWKYLGYDYAILGFTPYGPYWREIRKIVTLELLSARQLEVLKNVRATEVDLSIKALYKQWIENKKVAIKVEMDWFGTLTFNNVVMTVVGKRYFGTNTVEDANEVTKFNHAIFDLTFQTRNPTPSDAFPMLERFDIGGWIRATKKTAQELDSLCSIWLKEHRPLRLSGNHRPDYL